MEISTTHLPARWQLILSIARKDIVTILNHPYHLISLFLPLFISLVFLVLMPALFDNDTIRVVIYDEGSSQLPEQLAMLEDMEIERVGSATAVMERLTGEVVAGIVLPAGFDTAVTNGSSPELTIYLNSDARSSSIAKFQRFFVEETAALRDPAPAAQISWKPHQPGGSEMVPFSLENFLFTTMALLTTGIVTCSSLPHLLHEEKENGTLQALLSSPATQADVLMGKGVSAFTLTMLVILSVSLLNQGFVGSWSITLTAIMLTTLFMIGLGLLLGLLMHNNQAKAATSIAVLVAAMPSWFSTTSLESLAPATRFILRAIPTQHMVEALNHSLNGRSWAVASSSVLILLAWAVGIHLILAWHLQRTNLQVSQ
jgi:ABC-2 type transport system permease protein